MKDFTAYLESKGLAKTTQKEYLLRTKLFLNWVKKEDIQITKPDVLNYLEYLKNHKKNNNVTRAITLIAIRYYFNYLFENDFITQNPCWVLKIRGTQVKKLYKVYSTEALDDLYDNFYNFYIRSYEPSKYIGKASQEHIKLTRYRNLTVLGILIYQGVQTLELKNIKLDDVDLQKAKIKITSSKHARERTLPLKASQIGILINYIQNIRPELNCSEYLFDFENHKYNDIIKHLTHQIIKIDKNFKNFWQIRTSVITNWLKTENLRKTQYFAGHRSVMATECYIPNNLEELIEDITQKHHFL